MLFALIVSCLLNNYNSATAQEYQNTMSYILGDKNVLSFIQAYKKQGYDFYSIRDKKIALDCPEASDRDMIGRYILMFVKVVNYKPTERCWSDVSYSYYNRQTSLTSVLSCYPSTQKDILQQDNLTKVPYSFEGVTTLEIFGYGKEFKEVVSSSKKSSLFINTSTKEIKKGAMWDKDFSVTKDNAPNTFIISDFSGKFRVTFDKDFTKYDVVKI